jgi:hypothetical protein
MSYAETLGEDTLDEVRQPVESLAYEAILGAGEGPNGPIGPSRRARPGTGHRPWAPEMGPMGPMGPLAPFREGGARLRGNESRGRRLPTQPLACYSP